MSHRVTFLLVALAAGCANEQPDKVAGTTHTAAVNPANTVVAAAANTGERIELDITGMT